MIKNFFNSFKRNNKTPDLKKISYIKHEISKIDEKLYLNILFLISVLGFLLHLPSVLNSSSKVELLENTNIFYAIIYSTFPVVGFLLALKVKVLFVCK